MAYAVSGSSSAGFPSIRTAYPFQLQFRAVLVVLGFLHAVEHIEQERRRALQSIRIVERYSRMCKHRDDAAVHVPSPAPHPFSRGQCRPSIAARYCDLQMQRGMQTLRELEKREEKMVDSVIDLALLRRS